ncbi:uncharacterized protein [Euwallacea fornicatus]|uniref:uncharacterized protein isoform X2 n=1 Tax=Euwallacea fornicatus TaxID=995702 RepID=UPI00338E97F3
MSAIFSPHMGNSLRMSENLGKHSKLQLPVFRFQLPRVPVSGRAFRNRRKEKEFSRHAPHAGRRSRLDIFCSRERSVEHYGGHRAGLGKCGVKFLTALTSEKKRRPRKPAALGHRSTPPSIRPVLGAHVLREIEKYGSAHNGGCVYRKIVVKSGRSWNAFVVGEAHYCPRKPIRHNQTIPLSRKSECDFKM